MPRPSLKPVLLIGAGHMGGALLKSWIARGAGPVSVVEPNPSPALKKLARKGVAIFATIEAAPVSVRACVVALKPQVLRTEAARLLPIAQSGAPMISIAAGTSIKSLRQAWGAKAQILRAMPNMPGAIGKGVTPLYAPRGVSEKTRALAETLLAALGKTVWVKREALIDVATSVSGSGPAYIFLLAEAMEEAGIREGLPRETAALLARQTIIGAGAMLDREESEAAALRRAVTSPGGTTEAALNILMAPDGLTQLIGKAIAAAHRRARELGS